MDQIPAISGWNTRGPPCIRVPLTTVTNGAKEYLAHFLPSLLRHTDTLFPPRDSARIDVAHSRQLVNLRPWPGCSAFRNSDSMRRAPKLSLI
ncbi:uncharacterized protein MYCFIDRAFT_172619 [Pseudocercospora fijiensis CIRAD86]|uniref:Uncharacterized protein n=1 Tax=Pseudocercospora fijiensis (strain CIRAD86) TaxID=383855 RepID=M3AQN7_PSEFD|nr:uncharacterized protein MYCFIDRAFT_172619 [Pseudocercospora fijiensis CIRAD86]EME86931.1 hypothetical protein MYCFIDRAFT_172619 [Pseudocercospora fijiensis CIRAD86]